MALLSTTRTYQDGEVLLANDLDAFLDDIEIFLNNTRLNDDNIQNNGINGGTKIINASITGNKLANDAITTIKIADDAVTREKINADVAGNGLGQNINGALEVNVDGSTIEINSDALRVKDLGITTAKIDDLSITSGKIATGAIQTAKIQDGAITTAKIGNAQVTAEKLFSFPFNTATPTGSTTIPYNGAITTFASITLNPVRNGAKILVCTAGLSSPNSPGSPFTAQPTPATVTWTGGSGGGPGTSGVRILAQISGSGSVALGDFSASGFVLQPFILEHTGATGSVTILLQARFVGNLAGTPSTLNMSFNGSLQAIAL